MAASDTWDNLPDIDPLADEEITIEGIVAEMVQSYEEKYEEITGEELTLYPADERKIRINAVAEMLYQLAQFGADCFKQNFLKYSFGASLKNLGANIGYAETGEEAATTTLRFTLSETMDQNVTIPAGTEVTEGTQVYFATDEDLIIPAGELYGDTAATCTDKGEIGNGYAIGQLNVMVDSISYIDSVENTTETGNGHDEYTTDELRENIYNFPGTYSTAGPEDEYIALTKEYSNNIIDARVITNKEALVQIYVLFQNGGIPNDAKLKAIKAYIEEKKLTPDTDKIEVLAPETVNYTIKATYYIPYYKKEMEETIKESIEEMTSEFADYTRSKIGRAINPDMLIAFANAAGSSRISIEGLDYQKIKENQVAICTDIKLTYGGLEKE